MSGWSDKPWVKALIVAICVVAVALAVKVVGQSVVGPQGRAVGSLDAPGSGAPGEAVGRDAEAGAQAR